MTLTNADLLDIEQIESFLFPRTHLYVVTVPSQIRRTAILGNITLVYDGNSKCVIAKKKEFTFRFFVEIQHRIVEPLGNNVVTRLYASKTTKALVFRLDLPDGNGTSIDYSSRLQLFFADDQRQSILDHPVEAQLPPPITVNFLPVLNNADIGRVVRVNITHLCSPYLEIKAAVLNDSTVVARGQCDINKNLTSRDDIVHGRCSLFFDKLRPEQTYSLSIRATCQFVSSTSPYIFYDRTHLFPFRTPSGLPDGPSPKLFFHINNRTLSWTIDPSHTTYLGPEYRYELFIK